MRVLDLDRQVSTCDNLCSRFVRTLCHQVLHKAGKIRNLHQACMCEPLQSNGVNCVNSRSQAPWPVNLVIDAASQKQYNDVFLFLLHLKRAKWSLDDLRFKGKLKRMGYFTVLL